MNLNHNFVQLSKLNKKRSSPKMEHFFFPNLGEDQKKGLHQQWNTFFPKFKWTPTLRCTPESNYWGGCRCWPYSSYWGGYSQIIGGINPPNPPRVSAPLLDLGLEASSPWPRPRNLKSSKIALSSARGQHYLLNC